MPIPKNQSPKNIAERVRGFAEPVAASLGLTLWDVELVKIGSTLTLRFTIDKPDGVGITDCENFSDAIDPVLDEQDPIELSYSMQVTSPGIERELRIPAHFAACVGERVRIKLYAPDESGVKSYEGVLAAADEEKITLDLNGTSLALPYSKIARADTVYDF